ncbi:helix-turn-helix domain-containing protein [Komagataeibacter intermedius]|uniref:HTH cro/C1-type domain-containing protein n=1 Tax=Komagataeibacter intermedius AF2 TaxID=1458464 RepID=A0A0N1F9E4_9PROT|nr:helix-turn-helix transcriptional regulator [Komagataeibacter intermedius]KPH85365.1 hypothetical protein GLUCOINTEAF2_0201252 [Komagataeibacter intermedius AF2]MCF3637989.1 helix-turn-helix domain-containing protein [Komagataeibacter intermedius]
MAKKNYIREMREIRGLSQAKLANVLGVSQSQIDRLEKGQRRLTVEYIEKISKALDVSINDLLAGNDINIPQNTNNKNKILIDVKSTIKSQKTNSFVILDNTSMKVSCPPGLLDEDLSVPKNVTAFLMPSDSLSERWLSGDILYYMKDINLLIDPYFGDLCKSFRRPMIIFTSNIDAMCGRFLGVNKDVISFGCNGMNEDWNIFNLNINDIVSIHRIFEWEELLYGWRREVHYARIEDTIKEHNAK